MRQDASISTRMTVEHASIRNKVFYLVIAFCSKRHQLCAKECVAFKCHTEFALSLIKTLKSQFQQPSVSFPTVLVVQYTKEERIFLVLKKLRGG